MDFHRSLRKIRDLALQLTNDLPARAHASALAKIKSLFGVAFRLFLIDARVQSLSRTTDRTRTYDLVLGGSFAFGALWNATKLPRNAALAPLLRDLPSSLVKWAAIVHPVRAPPPSILRHICSVESSPLVGPEGDPDGWTVFEPVTVKGKIFTSRSVELKCTVSHRCTGFIGR